MKNNALTRAAITIITAGLVFLAFNTVTQVTQPANEITNTDTSVRPVVESRLIETHTVEYLEQPVTAIEYVDRVDYVPVKLYNFTSLNELKQWLMKNSLTTKVRFQSTEQVLDIDCDDYALELQQKAINEGYLMSFQIVDPERYNSLFEAVTIPNGTLHAINLVIIENTAYYIEPQTGEVVVAAYVD